MTEHLMIRLAKVTQQAQTPAQMDPPTAEARLFLLAAAARQEQVKQPQTLNLLQRRLQFKWAALLLMLTGRIASSEEATLMEAIPRQKINASPGPLLTMAQQLVIVLLGCLVIQHGKPVSQRPDKFLNLCEWLLLIQ
jgi:hypothetical protein